MSRITMNKSKDLTTKQALELFFRKCRIKNLSDKTIKGYTNHFNVIAKCIDMDAPISEVDSDTVDNFIIWMRENSKANDITINSYLRTLRAFIYYCIECNYLKPFKIRLPKAEKKLKETYTDDELARLLAKPNVNDCSFTEYKTWVFENYLLGTGNRISSALNVKISDLNFADGLIVIRKTKNRKQQIIPLSNTLADILTEYLQYRGNEQDDYLFCNNYGGQGTVRTFEQIVANYNITRNVNKTSCHLFRHTFAKKYILAGGNQFSLMRILGHSDLTVTKEYVQMFGADLQLDFDKFNPLDNIKVNKNKIDM